VHTSAADITNIIKKRFSASNIQSLNLTLATANTVGPNYRADVASLTDESPVWYATVTGDLVGFSQSHPPATGETHSLHATKAVVLVSAESGSIFTTTFVDGSFK